MSWLKEWWPQIVFAMLTGAAMIRYLIGHAKKHQQEEAERKALDARIERCEACDEKNSEEHKEILVKVDATKEQVAKIASGVEFIRGRLQGQENGKVKE